MRLCYAAAAILTTLSFASARAADVDCGRAVAAAGAPRTFESRAGQDTIHYPRDPRVQYKNLTLNLKFDDLAAKTFTATAEYTIRAIGPNVRSIELDAVDFYDVAVEINGKPASFSYDDKRLTITTPNMLPTDADTTLTIRYRVADPEGGMIFVPPDPAYPNRPVSMHTQGQTETNRYWFPSHDSPNVKFTTEVFVTVPKQFKALSNGKLMDCTDATDRKSHTFHYRQEVPHVAYLSSLAVGDFDVVTDHVEGTPVEYWVPKEWSADTRRTFANTPKMIALFGQLTGVKYPYAKYAQVVVPNFESGGMENISATTLVETCLVDERAKLDGDADGLIAHELAHQWYGDLLTCRTWAHIWLNEGFATFMDEVWFEHDKGRDWYECTFRNSYSRVADADKPESPDPLVYRDYEKEWEPFGHKGSLAYSKGSSVLAMLRHMLGDEIFWKGMQEYTKRFAARSVETDDFRHVMEEVSGRSLEQFFQEYCYRPGTPVIKIAYNWNADRKVVELKFTQTQQIDAKTPAFVVPVDIYLESNGKGDTVTFDLNARETTFTQACESEPTLICIDPHAGLLAKLKVDLPRKMRLAALKSGPTAVSRMDAANSLADDPRTSDVSALAACLSNDAEFWMVRNAAASALGREGNDAARDALITALTGAKGIENARVRRAAVAALGNYRYNPKAIDCIARFAKSDPSYAVEEAATEALGEARAASAADIILANLTRPTRYDRLTLSSLNALADLEDQRGLDAAMKLAAYGNRFRTRPQAIRLVGRFGRMSDDAGKVKARAFLERLLDDPQPMSVRAAINALGDLGDEKSIAALQARAKSGRGGGRITQDEITREVDNATNAIRSKQQEPAAVKSLRDEVEKIKKDNDDLRRRLEKLEPPEKKPDNSTARASTEK